MSIESQRAELARKFDAQPNIEIIDIIQESYSAKAPGRLLFDNMMARIERGEAEGIISWAPDRLARNSIDGGRIIYLLDTGTLRDLKFATYTFENNSQGKFMLQIMFGQSKYYSDALSENVKRGNRAKLQRGWRPNHAPLGYLNDAASKTIIPDPERFPLLREMFDLMLSGAHSPRQICRRAREEWGFRTPRRKRRGGSPIALSSVYKILTNPFYAGILLWDGRTYEGRHKPLVSIDEFDRVQVLLRRVEKPRPQVHTFPFTGMMRCGECGLLVTAEHKTNRYGSRYTYYHCTKRKFGYRCRQKSITSDDLIRQIEQFLRTISVPQQIHTWALKALAQIEVSQATIEQARQESLQKALALVEKSLSNLTSLRVRDLITDDAFINDRDNLTRESVALAQQLQLASHPALTLEPVEALILFNDRAADSFRVGDDETKRLIFELIGSNPRLIGKKLNVEAKKPFAVISKIENRTQLCAAVENIRTLLRQRDPELLKILENIKRLKAKLSVTLTERRAA